MRQLVGPWHRHLARAITVDPAGGQIRWLSIWDQEDALQQFRVGHHNEHIYQAIAAQVIEQGHWKTWQQYRTKDKVWQQQFTAVCDVNW